MKIKYRVIGTIFMIFISITLIATALISEIYVLLIIGIVLLVVNIFVSLLLSSIELFMKDKILDIDELKKQGFTIIECKKCLKNNVKEDVYCIFCGEKLITYNE